jgi:hypothetical protein
LHRCDSPAENIPNSIRGTNRDDGVSTSGAQMPGSGTAIAWFMHAEPALTPLATDRPFQPIRCYSHLKPGWQSDILFVLVAMPIYLYSRQEISLRKEQKQY